MVSRVICWFAGPFADPLAGPFAAIFAGPLAVPFADPFTDPLAASFADPFVALLAAAALIYFSFRYSTPLQKALLAISKQTRDELALSNARNLFFGKGLLTGATLSCQA